MASFFYVVFAFIYILYMYIFIIVNIPIFTELFSRPVCKLSIACVLCCCLCIQSAVFVMFGIVLMVLTRNLSNMLN